MKKYLLLIIDKKEIIWELIKKIIKEIFQVSLTSYLLFYLIDNFKPNFITDYFNLNILLIITIISGVITVLFVKEEKSPEGGSPPAMPRHWRAGAPGGKAKPAKIKIRDYVFILILGLTAAGLIYYKIRELGWLAYIIAPISGVIIILISILLFNEQKDDNNQTNEN